VLRSTGHACLFLVDQFAEHFDGSAVAQELPWREQIAPVIIPYRIGSSVLFPGAMLGRDHVQCLPVGKLLRQGIGHCLRDIVFRTGSAVTPDPLFLGFAGFRVTSDDHFLEDHGVELFPHTPACASALIWSPEINRPQSSKGQVASPPETVPVECCLGGADDLESAEWRA
jgi:hypothetical protein